MSIPKDMRSLWAWATMRKSRQRPKLKDIDREFCDALCAVREALQKMPWEQGSLPKPVTTRTGLNSRCTQWLADSNPDGKPTDTWNKEIVNQVHDEMAEAWYGYGVEPID